MNFRRPPDLGTSPTLSGVPTRIQVPMKSLASLLGSFDAPDGRSSARRENTIPVGSARATAPKRRAIRTLPRDVTGLFMVEHPFLGRCAGSGLKCLMSYSQSALDYFDL